LMEVAKKSMAQMDQRTLVRGEPAGLRKEARLSAVSGDKSDPFEWPEEKLLIFSPPSVPVFEPG